MSVIEAPQLIRSHLLENVMTSLISIPLSQQQLCLLDLKIHWKEELIHSSSLQNSFAR